MLNAKELKLKIDAEYKAHTLYVELLEASGGDGTALLKGLLYAMAVIKADIQSLLPPPEEEKAIAAQAPDQVEPVKADNTATSPPPVVDEKQPTAAEVLALQEDSYEEMSSPECDAEKSVAA